MSGPVNIGSGQPIPIVQVNELARRAGRTHLLRLGALPAREDDVPVLIPDVGRLRDEVGFRPALSLSEGLEKTFAGREHRFRSVGQRNPDSAN